MPPIAGSLIRAWKAIWVTNMEYDATCAVGTQSDSPIRGAGSNTPLHAITTKPTAGQCA